MSDEIWPHWLRHSRSNLAKAESGRLTPEILYEDLCFDAQQAAEKALKGLMVFLDLEVPRTHSVGYLVKLVEDSGKVEVPEFLKEAAILTDYAVTTRYPGDWQPVSEKDFREALSLAQNVYSWVLSVLPSSP